MPTDRVYDGRDMSDVLLKLNAPSPHTVLWLYNQDPHMVTDGGPSAGRMGRWKAHWATGPGLGGCSQPGCKKVEYPLEQPLLFDVVADPSEAYPLAGNFNASWSASPSAGAARLPCNGDDPCNGNGGRQGLPSGPGYATPAEIAAALAALVAARKVELAEFHRTLLSPAPDLPGEGPGRYGVCCNRNPYAAPVNASCDCNGAPN